jgi:tripartite-type tricarboxylate transporter receptor subunit TctC
VFAVVTVISRQGAAMRLQTPILVFSIILGSIVLASADDFPSRPIVMVVPFSAGGPTDSLALLWQILANGKVIRFTNQFLIDS